MTTASNMFPEFASGVSARPVASILAVALISGCSLAPSYERPAAVVPPTLGHIQAVSSREVMAPTALNKQELDFLHAFAPDRDLEPLVTRALTHNADYRQAALSVEQARAQYRIERATLLPTVSVNAQQLRRHFDDSALAERYGQEVVSTGVGINDYELDFFGRLKSLSEAARQRYLATEMGREAARGALVAEVLRAYTLSCAAAQARAQLQAIDDDSAALLAIAQRKTEYGLLSRNDLDRRRAQADNAHTAALQAAADDRATQRALQLLTGYDTATEPGTLAPLANAPGSLMSLRELDSQVLLQRPDIRQAEAELRAANADIGAARAAFFPSIRLSTSLGSASSAIDGLFEAGSRSWSFVPNLVLPVFDFGRNRANLDLAWTRKQSSVIGYEKAIESAFRDVANALDMHATLVTAEARLSDQDERAAKRIQRTAMRLALGLEDRQGLLADRIEAGQTYLNHLNALRDLALNRIALFSAFYGVALPSSL